MAFNRSGTRPPVTAFFSSLLSLAVIIGATGYFLAAAIILAPLVLAALLFIVPVVYGISLLRDAQLLRRTGTYRERVKHKSYAEQDYGRWGQLSMD